MAECGVSFNVCRVRVTELDSLGNGGGNVYVTDGVQSVALAVNTDTGNSFNVRNGCGCSISRIKLPDVFNWFEITFTDAEDEPELEALLTGQATISSGGNVVGINADFDLACDQAHPAVAFEFWTQHYVGSALDGSLPYYHWVFPWTEWVIGNTTYQEGPAAPVYTGTSKGNLLWGSGPHGDGPPDGSDVTEYARWLTATPPPTATCAGTTVAPGS